MAIDISKVVNVDFNVVQQEDSLSSYENTVDIVIGGEETSTYSYTSLEDAIAGQYATRQYDAYLYFQLGGKRLTCLSISTEDGATVQGVYNALLNYKKEVSNTSNDFICVCVGSCEFIGGTIGNLQSFMQMVNRATAPNKLLILNSTNDASVVDGTVTEIHNLIYKYYKARTVTSGVIDDQGEADATCSAELTIAAYLSQINIAQANSMRDYCFTDESSVINYLVYDRTLVPSDITSSQYDDYKNYLNFVDKIGSQYVNFGGNTVLGTSITSEWGAIASENGVVYSALSVMLQKQYLTDGGLTNILAAINNTLSDYITNGFLETNTTYTGRTRYKTYGNQSYVLVASGQELPNGYAVVSIPMSRITIEDRQARRFTPIFIYMQTMGGARELEITGDILD